MKIGPSTSDPTWPVWTLIGTASGAGGAIASGPPPGPPAAAGKVVARAAGTVAAGLGGAAAGPQPTAPPSSSASSSAANTRTADQPFIRSPQTRLRDSKAQTIRPRPIPARTAPPAWIKRLEAAQALDMISTFA